MAQKINPLAFRCLNNFEDTFCQQQFYKRYSLPYVLQENKKVMFFIRRFFKTFNLVLHSFKFVKTSQGIAHLSIKYVHIQSRNEKDFLKLVKFPTLENAFLHSFYRFFSTTPILVSFFNLDKSKKKASSQIIIKGSPFTTPELSCYLNVLTSIKGSAFFLANILSTKLYKMRSRIDRKSQTRFLVFVNNLLEHVFKHNNLNIKGIRVNINGRINGVPRSKSWCCSEGKMSLQRMDTKIDYYYLPSQTVYGTFGIKVWINYGD